MDICSTVAVNGASFVVRKTSFEKDLADLIAQAIQTEGFSLIDIWELCVAYYVPNNRFSRSLLEQTMDELGFARGILQQQGHEEFSRAYRRATAGDEKTITAPAQLMDVQYGHSLRQPVDITIAGSAGMRIGTAAGALSRGAVISGLWAAQRDDYPVTVRSGFSVSEVALDPQKEWDGADRRRQVFVVLFPEGLRKVRALLSKLSETDRVYVNAHLLPVETKVQVIPLDFSSVRRKEQWSMVAVAEILRHMQIYPLDAFQEAVALQPSFAEENLAAIKAGLGKVILAGR
jgi:Pyruvate/2-oxoacid:ferredoxin oxidoreductase gamma subunit